MGNNVGIAKIVGHAGLVTGKLVLRKINLIYCTLIDHLKKLFFFGFGSWLI
jgi:hypothetical protein